MTEYTAGTCEYCSGTGLRDAETLCPTCDGSGGRLPIVEAPEATAAPALAPEPEPVVATSESADSEPVVGGI